MSTYATGLDIPRGIAIDSAGNIYSAIAGAHSIAKIDLFGSKIFIAGKGTPGFANGDALGQATFFDPSGVAVSPNGDVYVADRGNHVIRQISSSGIVSTYAGDGIGGLVNGPKATARFFNPRRVLLDSNGDIYVADNGNHVIRKISAAGEVSTFAGNGTAGYRNGDKANAQFFRPVGMSLDADGEDASLYVADAGNNMIRKISSAGVVSTIAGSLVSGDSGGQGEDAKFYNPKGVSYDRLTGNLFVSDAFNNCIKMINSTGYVSIVAGSVNADPGTDNGPGYLATFTEPDIGNSIAANGNLFIADIASGRIRKMT